MLRIRLLALQPTRLQLTHPQQLFRRFADHNLTLVGNLLIGYVRYLLLNPSTDLLRINLQPFDNLHGQALPLTNEAKHQVFGADIAVAKPHGLLSAILNHFHQSFRIPYHA